MSNERKVWWKIPVIIALVLTMTGVLVGSSIALARQEIVINVDGKELRHKTLKGTVAAALDEAGVELSDQDQVTPDLREKVKRGMVVDVERAFPVRLVADGKETTVYTVCTPVESVLKLASLTLGEHDRVSPELHSQVEPGTEINVIRVTEETVKEQFAIPAATERKSDSSLLKGQQKVLREGSPGDGERQINIVYEDGKEVARKTVLEKVIQPPVSRVVAYGTTSSVSRGGQNLRFKKSLRLRATAYGPSTGKYTATGQQVKHGVVAVDPRVIPLWSRLYIDGYGYGRALDVGGAIKGNTIDLFFQSDAECWKWGSRYVTVYILE